ncbi:MAG: hypothetical protein RL226_1807, partial [Bacteroidota bacterium]
MYNVEPSALLFDLATFVIAFASACNTYQCVSPSSFSQQLSKPEGVPLYPSEMIIPFLTIKAPTFFRSQCDSFPHSSAIFKYARSYRSCLVESEYFIVFECNVPNLAESSLFSPSINVIWQIFTSSMLRHFLIFSLLTASLCSLAQELSFDVLTKREGLPSCSILDITEDKEGFMWVATEGQGLLSFDGVRFEPHPLATADSVFAVEEKGDSLLYLTREGLAVCHDDEISMLIELKNTPCTQFAVHENKLFLIRNDGALVQRSGDSLITLNDDDLHSGFVLSEGELFVLSDKGIAICDGKSNWMSLPDHDAPYSAIAKDKMLYVAGSDAVYLFENNQFTELPFTRDKHIKTIGIDVLGRLWMATRNSLMYEDANGLVEIGPKNGLPSGNISTIYTDRSGALWFGTAASGMFALRDMSVEQFTRTHGFPESRVTAIAIQGDSAGWIGTSDGQIFSIKRKKSLTPELIANVGTEIIDIHLCNSQVVFSTNNAVYRWQNNSIQKTSDLGGKLSGCPQSIILNNGIEFPGRKLSFSDLACDHLTDVISTDTLVFLTSSCGLFRIPLNQGKPDLPEEMTTFYPIEGSDLYEFTCAYVSKSGTYWFGTRHDGLLRYNGFNLEVVARKSLPDPSVTGICESTDGNIWISTPSGLCQVELNETGDLVMNIRSFSTTDEIVPGTLNAIHNRLVYGTPVGLRGFNPSGIFPDTYPLHVILSDVLVNFEPLREPQLAHDQNNLSFHFFAIDIADPYSVEYQCRLSGLESEYRTVTSPVIYSDLVPGDYVFEIRAKNHSGIWSVEP